MAKQPKRDTAPEIQLRRLLHSLGFRYRVDSPLPGMPRRRADIAFPGKGVVVFVDGCFWHKCPQHRSMPVTNADWWADKLARNVQRDRETDAFLEAKGWQVVRIWEHEPVEVAAGIVEAALQCSSGRGGASAARG
jgi:DNA mismatch endonuclease (patch repair protein)